VISPWDCLWRLDSDHDIAHNIWEKRNQSDTLPNACMQTKKQKEKEKDKQREERDSAHPS